MGILLGGNHAGLGGRMRSITWGRLLARLIGFKYIFIWPLSDACGGTDIDPNRDLFPRLNPFIPVEPWPAHGDWMGQDAKEKRAARKRMMSAYAAEYLEATSPEGSVIDLTTPEEGEIGRLEALTGFPIRYRGAGVVEPFEPTQQHRERFREELLRIEPAEVIRRRVAAFLTDHDLAGFIGVHVRRGDLERAGGKHPRFFENDLYFEALAARDPRGERDIFLCTESEDVIAEFVDRYGERVVYPPIAPNHRGSAGGIQDALVDILLLSRCPLVISGSSNFSALAAIMGGAEHLAFRRRKNA